MLESLGPTAREHAIRIRCRRDLQRFAREYFPEVCRLPFSRMHEYLFARRMEKTRQRLGCRSGEIDVVIAPRGAAKSSLISLVFPLHAMLYGEEQYIVLISATLRQATQRLANIRAVLASSPRLQSVFADRLGKPGNLRISTRAIEIGTARIEAFSAGTELRGVSHGAWRPTWIILDDVERSDRTLVSRHREVLYDWFLEVIENLGNGYTHIDLIGTLLHPEALPMRLTTRPDVRGQSFASILCEANDQALWEQWRKRYHRLEDPERVRNARRFFQIHQSQMLAGAEVLWPEKESYYQLQIMRETRGRAAFDKEKQNAPWSEGRSIFQVSALRRFTLDGDSLLREAAPGSADEATPRVALGSLRVFGFLDPAMGNPGGDFAAIAVVGVDPDGYYYVLEMWLERLVPSRQIAKVFDLFARWRFISFGFEANAFQRLMSEPFEQERQRRRKRGEPWQLPLVEQRHRQKKYDRIMALEPLCSNGWLLVNEEIGAEFCRQLEDFPNGAHDDGPDALAAAIALARRGSGTTSTPERITRRPTSRTGSF